MTTRRRPDIPRVGEPAGDARALTVRVAPGSAAEDLAPVRVGPAGGPDEPSGVRLEAAGQDRWILASDGNPARRRVPVMIDRRPSQPSDAVTRLEVVVEGWLVAVEVESARRSALRARATRGRADQASGGPAEVRAIIPGAVLSVAVVAGDAVEAGQQLLVVEAMKMQNEIRAPRAGTVSRVAVAAGGRVEVRDLLVVIE